MRLLLSLILVLSLAPAAWAGEKPHVFVSIVPQKYFVEKIAGDLVDATVMVPPGASPATYEPTPKQMAGLEGAAAYFSIGVPFEAAWLPRFAKAVPNMRIIPSEKGIKKTPMATHAHHDEKAGEHDAGADHKHGVLDPHVWLAPDQVRIIAKNIATGLEDVDAANKAVYQKNLQAFLKEIDALDAEVKADLAALPADKRVFMVFHPAWGYFAKEYGLTQIPIESEGKEPGPKQLAAIIDQGRKHGVTAIFVQPQFSDKSAKVIAKELGARVQPLNPLAPDWADNLRKAAETFKTTLSQ